MFERKTLKNENLKKMDKHCKDNWKQMKIKNSY